MKFNNPMIVYAARNCSDLIRTIFLRGGYRYYVSSSWGIAVASYLL